MNDDTARQIVLLRAFEEPLSPPWSAADAAGASAEAARAEGEQAAPEPLLVRRAALGCARLVAREPQLRDALAASDGLGRWGWGWALLPLALLAGLALDAVGPAGRLNLIGLPLLGMLAWNLVVYAGLLLHALRGDGPQRPVRPVDASGGDALARFEAAWGDASRPLRARRLAALLHAAAAVLAVGLLASIYWHGLFNAYRAGWDSTFLSPEAVRGLLSVVLWPALALTGDALPTPEQLAALRFSAGSGESAARWIHWLALTVGLVVVLPRSLLAAHAAWQARRLARQFPLPLDAPYFQRLLRGPHGGAPVEVQVLPYSYHVAPELRAGLLALLERGLGSRVALQLEGSLPLGSEDALERWLPAGAAPGATLLPLFALTATPERETHGAFIETLAAHRGGGTWRRVVLVDESGFRRSFDATRLAQRRAAWQRLLDDLGQLPCFVDLASPDLDAADAALQRARAAAPAERSA